MPEFRDIPTAEISRKQDFKNKGDNNDIYNAN